MIRFKQKSDCCGCSACTQICPKGCILMKEDDEGFFYPEVDARFCIDCHKCESVCPVINRHEARKPIRTYAARDRDESIVQCCSSGGVFDSLARKVLEEKGVVFGVKLDEHFNAVHTYIEAYEDMGKLRGSKYIQSAINDSYKDVKRFLEDNRKVLFSGTPCQVAGLKNYLGKEFGNLILIEVVCHGTPSSSVWKTYLDLVRENVLQEEINVARSATAGKNTVLPLSLKLMPVITGISFREKDGFGWEKFGFVVRGMSASKADKNSVLSSDIHYNNIYMKGFLSNLYLRPSCYRCPARCLSSGADITLGDYWRVKKIHPDFYTPKGISLVMINTDKGKRMFDEISNEIEFVSSSYSYAVKVNPVLVMDVPYTKRRDRFYDLYKAKPRDLVRIVEILSKKSLVESFLLKLRRHIITSFK